MLVFIAAWMNLGFQVPIHAAMKQALASSGYSSCQCQPGLCDTVISTTDQTLQGMQPPLTLAPPFSAILTLPLLPLELHAHTGHFDRVLRAHPEHWPPPQQLKTVLRI